jgi:hypothetical protein
MSSYFATTFRSAQAVRPVAAARGLSAVRPACRPLRASRLVCRAEHSDAESQDFQALAKVVAGRLASELASGQDDMFGKLQSWWVPEQEILLCY